MCISPLWVFFAVVGVFTNTFELKKVVGENANNAEKYPKKFKHYDRKNY